MASISKAKEAEFDISLADPLEENGIVVFVASEPEPVEPAKPKAKPHK